MPHSRELHLTLSNADAAELIPQLAQERDFAEDQVMQLGMAVRKSVVSAVTHGNGYSKSGLRGEIKIARGQPTGTEVEMVKNCPEP